MRNLLWRRYLSERAFALWSQAAALGSGDGYFQMALDAEAHSGSPNQTQVLKRARKSVRRGSGLGLAFYVASGDILMS